MSRAVVFVHGLRPSGTMWRQQVERLDALGIRSLTVDLPGHGSKMGQPFDLEGALRTIGDAVDQAAASGRRPYLVGFSLGGYLSIEWVARNHGRVAGLLAAACGSVPSRPVMHAWRAVAKIIARLPDRGLWLNNTAVRMLVPQPGAGNVLVGGVALDIMDDSIRALMTVTPLESLRRIREPVLFVNGRWDHVRAHARRYLAATHNGRIVTVPGAHHLVPVCAPHAFTDALLDGYREVASAP